MRNLAEEIARLHRRRPNGVLWLRPTRLRHASGVSDWASAVSTSLTALLVLPGAYLASITPIRTPVAVIQESPLPGPSAKETTIPAWERDDLSKSGSVTGSIPQEAEPPVTGPAYAVLFPENASDQERARSLAIGLQQKYADLLAPRRLTFRGSRSADGGTNYRVRLSRMTLEDATRICNSVKDRGGECEVGAN